LCAATLHSPRPHRPPPPPLLPYTTLFRSPQPGTDPTLDVPHVGVSTTATASGGRDPGAVRAGAFGDRVAVRGELPEGPGVPAGQDRKSTRLNSSHVSISYAVFCLKKKT